MSFNSIPASLLLKMFHRLPFKDRVHLRGVNRLFNEISCRSIETMRSLEINNDLEAYSIYTQTLLSLLESCSSTLESINITNRSCSNWMLTISALTEFVYPKLEHLELTVTNNELTKKLISRNRNLRSVTLYLSGEFEWPEDIVFEKLENLEIHSSTEFNESTDINLSPTLRPLIGKVPKLERLWIERKSETPIILSVEDLNQLLACVPCLETLHLHLFRNNDDPVSVSFINMCRDFVAAIPTWHLPKLTYLVINMKCLIPSSILHFPTSFPQLKRLHMLNVKEIDDQALAALSRLNQLKKVYLPDVEMTKDNLSKVITLLPSITDMQFKKINRESLLELPQLQYLSFLCVYHMAMTKAEIIGLVTSIPTLAFLGIAGISDAGSFQIFVDFVTSTTALFHRNLEIRISMRFTEPGQEMGWAKSVLKNVEKNGGPVVEMDGRDIRKIHYKSLA